MQGNQESLHHSGILLPEPVCHTTDMLGAPRNMGSTSIDGSPTSPFSWAEQGASFSLNWTVRGQHNGSKGNAFGCFLLSVSLPGLRGKAEAAGLWNISVGTLRD